MKRDCGNCDGKCCRYVALEIDKPTDLEDFENIKWYVCHENVNVFVDIDGKWFIEFLTPCEFLGRNNECNIYDKRPKICREYSQEDCLFHNDDYGEKYTFKIVKDVEDYIKNNLKNENKS
ncbi:zinc/iron-chelating domain-containing protein [Candidatus Pacearchaeota archaeon]|nr:zinc/iron-chelating domain-containing protein [Candidatus Pacearchaeota archaeon]|tara:strand:- start:1106 stop:1465 length:360 start_codon:yes stop_codon:yes gene_type:complete